MKTQVVVASLCAVLAACSSWPQAGKGGVAEVRPTRLANIAEVNALRDRLAQNQLALRTLADAGADVCVPGGVQTIDNDLVRVERELHAGMFADMRDDLRHIEMDLALLNCRLMAVRQSTGCSQTDSTVRHNQNVWYAIDRYDACLPHRAQVKVIAAKAPKATPLTLLNEALFDYNKADIKDIYRIALDDIARLLHDHHHLRLAIVGHTDSDGAESYNDTLAQHRANAVADYFQRQGIDVSRLSIVSVGERNPRSDNQSEAGRQLNRRVEMRIYAISGDESQMVGGAP